VSTDVVELLLHPVRTRIVHAMVGGRVLTTADLCARMPDVSQATMYRQVAVLAEAGVLEVESEERIRGPAERRYRLREERTRIKAEAGAAMSLEDHRRGFAIAMGVLLAEFNGYLDRKGADPYRDRVGYRQFVVWLSEPELEALQAQLRTALAAVAEGQPAADRRPYLLSAILFPTDHRDPGPDT
jgi:DNA-binding transcriptional ArsR family regulator